MYIIIVYKNGDREFFGPFTSTRRAEHYASNFEQDTKFVIRPITVPNCVTVRTNY